MSNAFLGLPVEVQLVAGASVTGTVTAIDAQLGTLTLDGAVHSTRPHELLPSYTVQRGAAAGLKLLSVDNDATPAAPPPPPKAVTFVDPAIMSMGRLSPMPSAAPPPTVVISHTSPPLATATASTSTEPAQLSARRRRRKYNPAKHRGSEADESTALAAEDDVDDTDQSTTDAEPSSTGMGSSGETLPARQRRGARGGRRARVASSPQPAPVTAADEFDFAAGLASFDKKKIFAEIRDTDKSDPALLLVSHNRRKADARYTTKLLPTENVLDNGSTAEEDFTSGNEQPMATPLAVIPPILPPLPSPRHVSRRSSSKSMRPLGIFGPAGRLQTVTARQFREIEQLANIELGPNPQQRVENAGRGIAELVLDPASGLYNGDEGEGRPAVVLLCGANSLKGPSALRAGAHLLNRGVHVTAFVPPSETLPGVFETYLRYFSAAGGKVVRALVDLPVDPDLVLDGLLDLETSAATTSPDLSLTTKRRPPRESEVWAIEWANAVPAPTVAVGWSSGSDVDTADPLWPSTPGVAPAATVSLGAVRAGASAGPTATGALWLVDLGLPLAAYERTAGLDGWRSPFGRRWVVPLRYQ